MIRKSLFLLTAATLVLAVPVDAQQSRADLLEQARGEFDQDAALDLLMRAADPTAAPPDTLWAVSVYELALTLTGIDRSEDADLWLRLAARQTPGLPIDEGWFPESLVEAYERAVRAVERAPDQAYGATETGWQWTDDFEAEASGRVEVESAGVPGLEVDVEGRGSVPVGQATELPPGTYRIQASAPGHEPVHVTREVLPGVTTVLTFDLPPQFPDDARSQVTSGLVRIRAGADVCVDGVLQPDGLILTSLSALPRTTGLEVVLAGGEIHGSRAVVQRDAGRDLAVLRLDEPGGTPLTSTGAPEDGQWAWSVYRAGCADPTTATTRVGEVLAGGAAAELAAPVADDAVGAPLVDLSGSLLGIVVGPSQVASFADAQTLLAQALAAPEGAPGAEPQADSGGGFPLKWVAAGVGVVGVAALVAGGGGGGGNGEPPPPTGIRITLPGGAP